MKSRVFLIFILCYFNLISYSQGIDSLKSHLSKQISVSDYGNTLFEIFLAFTEEDLDSSFLYIDRTLEFAKNNQLDTLEIQAYGAKSALFYHTRQLEKSLIYSDSGINHPQKEGKESYIYDLLQNKILTLSELGNYEAAKLCVAQSLTLGDTILNPFMLLEAYSKYGNFAFEQNNWNEAIRHYYKALTYIDESTPPRVAQNLYSNLGRSFYTINDYDNAIIYYKQSLDFTFQEPLSRIPTLNYLGYCYLEKNEFEKARNFLQEAIDLNKIAPYLLGDSKLGLSKALYKIGLYDKKTELISESIKYAKEAYDIFETSNDIEKLYTSAIYIVDLLINTEKYHLIPKWIYLEELYLKKYSKATEKDKQVLNFQKTIYEINSQYGKDARDRFLVFKAQVDSSYKKELAVELQTLEVSYQTEIKEDSIKILQATEMANKATIKNQRLTNILIGLGLFGTSVISFLFYSRIKTKEKNNQLLSNLSLLLIVLIFRK